VALTMKKTDVKYFTPFLILGAFFLIKAAEPDMRVAYAHAPQSSVFSFSVQK
jgi:hypothetical protein